MASAETIEVEVAYSPAPGQLERWSLHLDAGSSVGDALARSGLLQTHPELTLAELSIGVWGALRPLAHPLRDRDRVEVYRPLKVDPKEARRQRHRRHRENRRA